MKHSEHKMKHLNHLSVSSSVVLSTCVHAVLRNHRRPPIHRASPSSQTGTACSPRNPPLPSPALGRPCASVSEFDCSRELPRSRILRRPFATGSLPRSNVFELHPCCLVCQNLLAFKGWIIFPCMDGPYLLIHSACVDTFRLLGIMLL